MSQNEWKNKLKEVELYTNLNDYVPLKYHYFIKETEKAVLLKFESHVAEFVPKSVLLHDRYGIRGKQGWIYISNQFRLELIKQHAEVNLGI